MTLSQIVSKVREIEHKSNEHIKLEGPPVQKPAALRGSSNSYI